MNNNANNNSKTNRYSFFDESIQKNKNVPDNPTDAYAPLINSLNISYVKCINNNIDTPEKCDPIKDLIGQHLNMVEKMDHNNHVETMGTTQQDHDTTPE